MGAGVRPVRPSLAVRPGLPLIAGQVLEGVLPHRVLLDAPPPVQLVQVQAPQVVWRGVGERQQQRNVCEGASAWKETWCNR